MILVEKDGITLIVKSEKVKEHEGKGFKQVNQKVETVNVAGVEFEIEQEQEQEQEVKTTKTISKPKAGKPKSKKLK